MDNQILKKAATNPDLQYKTPLVLPILPHLWRQMPSGIVEQGSFLVLQQNQAGKEIIQIGVNEKEFRDSSSQGGNG